jgi:hypothetical protein
MQKMTRLLYANGIDPNKAKILNVETAHGQSVVYVEYENITYSLDGFSKTIVESNDVKKSIDNSVSLNTKKQRGWHFMAVYVDQNGVVYHRGIEQPELFGTLDPTIL